MRYCFGDYLLDTARRDLRCREAPVPLEPIMRYLLGQPVPFTEGELRRLAPVDLVLVEGFGFYPFAKLEVVRPDTGKPPLGPELGEMLAVVSPAKLEGCPLPRLDLNDPAGVAGWITAWLTAGRKAVVNR